MLCWQQSICNFLLKASGVKRKYFSSNQAGNTCFNSLISLCHTNVLSFHIISIFYHNFSCRSHGWIPEAFCTAHHKQVSPFSAEPRQRDKHPFALVFTTVCHTWRESTQSQSLHAAHSLESKLDLLGVWQTCKFIAWHLCSCCPNLSLTLLLSPCCWWTRSSDTFTVGKIFRAWHRVSDLPAWGQRPRSLGFVFFQEELYAWAPQGHIDDEILRSGIWPVLENGLNGSEQGAWSSSKPITHISVSLFCIFSVRKVKSI